MNDQEIHDRLQSTMAFLHLIRNQPDILPPADRVTPENCTSMIDERRRSHMTCIRCGEPARSATVATTTIGLRWLDLCPTCYHYICLVNESWF